MIRLQLYPSEFLGLVDFLSDRVTLLLPLEMFDRSIYDQVLLEYWHKARLRERVITWSGYNGRKRYSLPMSISVARILHQEMQHVELTIYAQAFLATLDHSLTNENATNVYAVRR